MAQRPGIHSLRISIVPADLIAPIFNFRFSLHDNHITLHMIIHEHESVRLEIVPINDILMCQITVNSDFYPEAADDIPNCEINTLGVVTVSDVLATIENFGLHWYTCSPVQFDCAYWFMILIAVLELKNRVPAGSTVRVQELFVFSPTIRAIMPGIFGGEYAQRLAVDIWLRLGQELEQTISGFREESHMLLWIGINLENEAAKDKRVQLLKQFAARGDILRGTRDLVTLNRKVRHRMATLDCQLVNWQTTTLILKGCHGENIELVDSAQGSAEDSSSGHSE